MIIFANLSPPFGVVSAPRDPFEPARIVAVVLFVDSILASVRFPQVAPAVVRRIAVDMIDPKRRPLAGHEKPSKASALILRITDADEQVSPAPCARPIAGPHRGFERRFQPSPFTRVGVIVQNLPQSLGGKGVARLRIWGLSSLSHLGGSYAHLARAATPLAEAWRLVLRGG